MRYQLILQWPVSSVDYDVLIDIEDLLLEKITVSHSIDGHDLGADQADIFIITDEPIRAFEEVRLIMEGSIYWRDLRAAFRKVSGVTYNILWPSDLETFNVC